MAKRARGWTENKIARYIKEGRGSGELSSYLPWLTVQDVSSKGNSPRIKGWKTGRSHELFSNLERSYFYYLEWANDVVDIREQFPLNREETIRISSNLNIAHPIDDETKTPIVFTTDFLITLIKDKDVHYLARTIKPPDDLEDPRVIDKFEIEQIYWQEQGVDWAIVTENEFEKVFVSNVHYIHKCYYLENDDDIISCNLFKKYLIKMKNNNKHEPIIRLFEEFEEAYNLEEGSCLFYFKHMVARKVITIDMFNQKINPRNLTLVEIEILAEGSEESNEYYIS